MWRLNILESFFQKKKTKQHKNATDSRWLWKYIANQAEWLEAKKSGINCFHSNVFFFKSTQSLANRLQSIPCRKQSWMPLHYRCRGKICSACPWRAIWDWTRRGDPTPAESPDVKRDPHSAAENKKDSLDTSLDWLIDWLIKHNDIKFPFRLENISYKWALQILARFAAEFVYPKKNEVLNRIINFKIAVLPNVRRIATTSQHQCLPPSRSERFRVPQRLVWWRFRWLPPSSLPSLLRQPHREHQEQWRRHPAYRLPKQKTWLIGQ